MKEIKLTQGKVALVDDEDLELVNQFKWWCKKYKNGLCYAVSSSYNKKTLMHRLIMGITDPLILVDHRNRNTLDNQKVNLRKCSRSQNNANRKSLPNKSSKYLGVSWNKDRRKWIANISKNNKSIPLGAYDFEREAAKAYNEAAIKVHGEFANLNQV